MSSDVLDVAKEYYRRGWAVHFIKPNSKAPVKAGWSGPKRDDWTQLTADYRKGYGLGVRLGEASKLAEGGYLANIDVDIKSADPRHRQEALAFLDTKFQGLEAPVVETGYGLRYFVRTEEPVESGKLGASGEETRVLMPSAPINDRQRKLLTEKELAEGWRIRPAWEVEFMSAGRQVVLPPSVHPETGKLYRWRENGAPTIPLVTRPATGKAAKLKGDVLKSFDPVEVDLSRLPESTRAMIVEGTEVADRSSACFLASIDMIRMGYSDLEIMSVLTDDLNYLGQTAYDHRQTTNRAAAAAWVRDYCIKKALEIISPVAAFKDKPVETATLDEKETAAQLTELVTEVPWLEKLQRTQKGGLSPTLRNVVMIIQNAVSPKVFVRDLFASRDFYGCNTPWGGKKDAALTDDDGVKIKHWLACKFGVEPSVGVIFEAMTVIAAANGFHPVRERLLSLPAWDGTPRVDGWLKKNFQAKGPDEYLAQVFRKWLVASVTRTFEPGAKFDWMLLLEGKQGTGKSFFGSILFGEDYFTDWLPPLADKDAALGLQGICCVEFGELDQLRRNELETTKAFITRRTDKVRPPYGKRWVESKRQCVFFGTTNKDEYLKDDSGNRRFNPVEVGNMDFAALRRDRVQLWAEVLFIYQCSLERTLYLEGEAEEFAKSIQTEKMVSDDSNFMVEALVKFISLEKEKPVSERFNFEKFKATALFGDISPLKEWVGNARNLQFATKALKSLGFEKKKIMGVSWWKRA